MWLTIGEIHLYNSDKAVLSGVPVEWLNDNHLLGALRRIESFTPHGGASQAPSLSQSACRQAKYLRSDPKCSHAIHGGGGNQHWTLASNVGGEDGPWTRYVDAFKASITKKVRAILCRLYVPVSGGSFRARRMNPWVQDDSVSCGHRVLGWAYKIAHGASIDDVSDTFFDVERMPAWVQRLLEGGVGVAGPPPVADVPAFATRVHPGRPNERWWWMTVRKNKIVSDQPVVHDEA